MVRTTWIALSAVVLVAAGVAWTTYQEVDAGIRRSTAIPPDAPRSASGTTVLVMGLTTRRDLDGGTPPEEVLDALHAGDVDRGGYNANTLILLHLSPGGGAKALSLPRDNGAELLGIPGGPQRGKVKEAYGRAKEAVERTLSTTLSPAEQEWRGREAGRRAQVQTVSALLDVPVDHLVEVSMVGFHHLAEALGGVDVCLNRATADPYSGADFPAGPQHLTPAQSLAFVRQRHGLPNGDLDRTRRQQAFLSALVHRLKTEGPAALGRVAEVAKHNVVLSEGWDVLASAQGTSGVTFSTLPLVPDDVPDPRPVLRAAAAATLHPAGGPSGPGSAPSPVPCVD
ncbi:LCP family protein [Saccharothrix sp. DSM 118769]